VKKIDGATPVYAFVLGSNQHLRVCQVALAGVGDECHVLLVVEELPPDRLESAWTDYSATYVPKVGLRKVGSVGRTTDGLVHSQFRRARNRSSGRGVRLQPAVGIRHVDSRNRQRRSLARGIA
jgi:hypothetical protein